MVAVGSCEGDAAEDVAADVAEDVAEDAGDGGGDDDADPGVTTTEKEKGTSNRTLNLHFLILSTTSPLGPLPPHGLQNG